MVKMRWGWVVLILWSGQALAQRPPSEEDLAIARDYAAQARKFAASGDCRMAIGGFEEAYALSKDPKILPEISSCYEELEHELEALRAACWYQETAIFPEDKDAAERSARRMERLTATDCETLPSADGSAPVPALRVEEPPKLRRFAWPATFGVLGGIFATRALVTKQNPSHEYPIGEDPQLSGLAFGTNASFSTASLALYAVAEKSRVYPSFWMNPDGTIDANVYVSMPRTTFSITLNTRQDGASLLVDISRKLLGKRD
jgi:hypothetical protein